MRQGIELSTASLPSRCGSGFAGRPADASQGSLRRQGYTLPEGRTLGSAGPARLWSQRRCSLARCSEVLGPRGATSASSARSIACSQHRLQIHFNTSLLGAMAGVNPWGRMQSLTSLSPTRRGGRRGHRSRHLVHLTADELLGGTTCPMSHVRTTWSAPLSNDVQISRGTERLRRQRHGAECAAVGAGGSRNNITRCRRAERS
mmetsp:Transcript_174730/g.560427  ORF Transcript_174730/g.560427 Transcript_174730/m.560427 type:complete len:203 (-) Transcript_174730:21-629(-)